MGARRSVTVVGGLVVMGAWAFGVAVQSAYRGHASDADVHAVLAAYPAAKGGPNDACSVCHRAGDVADPTRSGRSTSLNHCDFCHAVFVAQKQPAAMTLNPYGKAYLAAGRGEAAVKVLGGRDTDGDGFSNDREFAGGTNPGDQDSSPAAPLAPSHRLTLGHLRTLPAIERAVLINVTKNRAGDSYNDYRGVRLLDALASVGLSDRATSVDLISFDGFERTVTLEDMNRTWPQAPPVMGLGTPELGPCGFVNYNAKGLKAGTPLRDAPIMLAVAENGVPLEKARLDPATGRIVGTGPFRLITPQVPPSGPDQSSTADAGCLDKVPAAVRFSEQIDHNGGKSSFAIIAIRAKPLPPGTRDPDWISLRDALVANEQILVFGAVAGAAPVK